MRAVLILLCCAATAHASPIHFYCDDATCVLGAKEGDDVFAARFKKCGAKCTERPGAWCVAKMPASSEINPFRGDKAKCFVDEARCSAFDKSRPCAAMSVKQAMEDLEDHDRDRAEPPALDYHCGDVVYRGQCFDSSWACEYRRYQWLSPTSSCKRAKSVWCYDGKVPGVDRLIESCAATEEKCSAQRHAGDKYCHEKWNPTH